MQDMRIRQQEVQMGQSSNGVAAKDSVKFPGENYMRGSSGKNYEEVLESNNFRARSQDDRGPNIGESGNGIVTPNM